MTDLYLYISYFLKIKSKKITKQIVIFFVLVKESDVTTLKKYPPHSVLNAIGYIRQPGVAISC